MTGAFALRAKAGSRGSPLGSFFGSPGGSEGGSAGLSPRFAPAGSPHASEMGSFGPRALFGAKVAHGRTGSGPLSEAPTDLAQMIAGRIEQLGIDNEHSRRYIARYQDWYLARAEQPAFLEASLAADGTGETEIATAAPSPPRRSAGDHPRRSLSETPDGAGATSAGTAIAGDVAGGGSAQGRLESLSEGVEHGASGSPSGGRGLRGRPTWKAGSGVQGQGAGTDDGTRSPSSSYAQQQRLHVAKEIESTEQSYLKRLHALRSEYVVGLYAGALGPEMGAWPSLWEVVDVFRPLAVENLVRLHMALLADVQRALRALQEGEATTDMGRCVHAACVRSQRSCLAALADRICLLAHFVPCDALPVAPQRV